MDMVTIIFRDALQAVVRRGDLATVERVLARVHGLGPWEAAQAAVDLCALAPPALAPRLERLAAARAARSA